MRPQFTSCLYLHSADGWWWLISNCGAIMTGRLPNNHSCTLPNGLWWTSHAAASVANTIKMVLHWDQQRALHLLWLFNSRVSLIYFFTTVADILSDQLLTLPWLPTPSRLVLHGTGTPLPIRNHANTIKQEGATSMPNIEHTKNIDAQHRVFLSQILEEGKVHPRSINVFFWFIFTLLAVILKKSPAKKVLNWCPIKWFSSFVVLQLVYFSHFPHWFQRGALKLLKFEKTRTPEPE